MVGDTKETQEDNNKQEEGQKEERKARVDRESEGEEEKRDNNKGERERGRGRVTEETAVIFPSSVFDEHDEKRVSPWRPRMPALTQSKGKRPMDGWIHK